MSDLQIIGAGFWRTGTISLESAIKTLLGGKVLNMGEVMINSGSISMWRLAINNKNASLDSLTDGYVATLDWPAMAFWEELSLSHPNAKVLLSIRDAESWWESISKTVLINAPTREAARSPWDHLVVELFEKKFIGRNPTKIDAIAFYNAHNDRVIKTIPKDRLIIWRTGDDWTSLCDGLKLPIPDKAFPHLNTADDYRRMNNF
jgi:Sulfotransferase domain